jgi:hypothetical protein
MPSKTNEKTTPNLHKKRSPTAKSQGLRINQGLRIENRIEGFYGLIAELGREGGSLTLCLDPQALLGQPIFNNRLGADCRSGPLPQDTDPLSPRSPALTFAAYPVL